MNRRWSYFALCILTSVAFGCPNHPVEADPSSCPGEGENAQLPTDRELCVYRWSIVIETGFGCPAHRPDQTDFPEHFAACSDFGPPLKLERDFLIDRYGIPGRPWPVYTQSPAAPQTDQIDILWVIDNSGSMCQEQTMLRRNFASFVDEISATTLDFQVAITTTHTNPEYPLEPVAQPGRLQSTPQPVPGFDRSCHTATDESGMPVDGDYAPIKEALEVAVGCMETPDESYLDITPADIECALYNQPTGCEIPRVGCTEGTACVPEDLFPPPGAYRELPRVLRSVDYLNDDGTLDAESFQADFACASLVGTRGYGIEQGLGAAVTAVSPQLAETANAGFLRRDARFAVMFVTDENDCTHDGSIAEDTVCGGDVCEFWNHPDHLGGPLVPPAEIKSQLLGNLSVSKGRTVTDSEVFVGSIHGISDRFTGEAPTQEQCSASDYSGISPTCQTSLGIAYSGDRYERFLLQFPPGNFFPPSRDESDELKGWMCQGDFSPAIQSLGSWLGSSTDLSSSD